MKTIGLIGGMSWQSSILYYELINKKVNKLLGGFHSCKNIMLTVDFAEIETLQRQDDWQSLNRIMSTSAKQLELVGAEIVLLCTNTMHLCADIITESISIPFLHIVEATGQKIIEKKIKKVGLLGTKFTMEKGFYQNILIQNYNIDVLTPSEQERYQVHKIIFGELVHGIIKDSSIDIYKNIIKNLEKQGAEGIILGCTEIPLLISSSYIDLPIFNTTEIHAETAVKWAFQES